MTLGEQRHKALELLAPPPSRHDHSSVVRPLSYSRPHQAGTTTPMAASRASRGSASSKPSVIGVLAERHARHLAERAQTLQDARKPMHTDPSNHLGDLLSENNARTVSKPPAERNAAAAVFCPARLEIDVGRRRPVGVADDEAGARLLDAPGRRKRRGALTHRTVHQHLV